VTSTDQTGASIVGTETAPFAGIQIRAKHRHGIWLETRIAAATEVVFAHLIDARRMTTWLARDVKADPQPGGTFRLSELNGLWIEGSYLQVVPHRMVIFSWGGLEGLKIGKSTVKFSLHPESNTTLLRLDHSDLTEFAVDAHCFLWTHLALPRLKAVAEGGKPAGNCFADFSDEREQHPYRALTNHNG
jgi:uncharacterized protein YndB with AHSA1/START domain